MILSLASLYSLSWSPDGENILVLTKTSQTVKPAGAPSEFAVPGIPTSRQLLHNQKQMSERRNKDTKRQRRTPPLPTVRLLEKVQIFVDCIPGCTDSQWEG
jgi:hypothetical protein